MLMVITGYKDKREAQQWVRLAMEVENIFGKGVGIFHTKKSRVNARQVCSVSNLVMTERY